MAQFDLCDHVGTVIAPLLLAEGRQSGAIFREDTVAANGL